MAKKIISDIITTKRSIRQVPISAEKIKRLEKELTETETVQPVRPKRLPSFDRKPLNPKFVIWSIAIICLLALFFGLSILFTSATVTVTPREQAVEFSNEAYTAKSNSGTSADLSFEVLSVNQTLSETVPAGAEKDVSLKASGQIVIYNNYSSVSQRLTNNTRFEATNGKIYRISNSVVVPGQTKANGKTVPGSIEATVYADQPGENYNMKVADLTGDFKIPGFKGDPRYNSFYARIKTDIMGGFVGKQRVVDEADRASAVAAIKSDLREQLLKELYAVKPDTYIFFPDGYSVAYLDQPEESQGDSGVKISLKGVLSGIVFNNQKLAAYLANKKIASFDGLPVSLVPGQDFSVSFSGADTSDLAKNQTLQIKLSGQAFIRWQYDADSLRRDLIGKNKNTLKDLAGKYQASLAGLEVSLQPFWSSYLPDDSSKIELIQASE